jgi:hypothetical protein
MGDADQPTMADVMQILQTLTANMSQMQSDMAGMQAKLNISGPHERRLEAVPPPVCPCFL